MAKVIIVFVLIEYSSFGIKKQLTNWVNDHTIILVDTYSNEFISGFHAITVNSNCGEKVRSIKNNHQYSRIIAIGGCTVQDIARACAESAELICIPSMISTSCIGADRSVLLINGEQKILKFKAPDLTIIDSDFLLQSTSENLVKWTQSGFGDLLSNISASIDHCYHNELDFETENDRENKDILEWINHSFTNYDIDCINRVAQWSFNSSQSVIERDTLNYKVGGEHEFYYTILRHDPSRKVVATHGQIVAIASLIIVSIYCQQSGKLELYKDFRTAYTILQLPSSFDELSALGITRELIIDTIQLMSGKPSLLSNILVNKELLDKVFAK